jgi:oxygen-independent coproporphyrinogen III oxidase
VTGPQAPVALYVHVPFCVSICPYCDFVVYAGAAARGPSSRVGAFVEALLAEIDLRADALDDLEGAGRLSGARQPLASVYVGGGTPSLLPVKAVASVLDRIRHRFGIADAAEITLEVNPGPDERGDARAWRDAGVTRVSVGAQSMNPGELRRLGRRHAPDDVAATVTEARTAGVGSVSLDLLYDVPDGSLVHWAATLEAVLALGPDHLSLYALTLDDPDAEGLTGAAGDHLPASAGARRWRERSRSGQDEDRAAAQYEHAVSVLATAGWRGYEISNWARPGHESRHNLSYWQRRAYEAVGPGAHAFDGTTRRWNAARLDAWLRSLLPREGSPGQLPPGGSERIDEWTADAERVVLGLRTDRGVPAEAAERPPLDGVAAWAFETRLLERQADRLVLTTRGRLLSNELFARLV